MPLVLLSRRRASATDIVMVVSLITSPARFQGGELSINPAVVACALRARPDATRRCSSSVAKLGRRSCAGWSWGAWGAAPCP